MDEALKVAAEHESKMQGEYGLQMCLHLPISWLAEFCAALPTKSLLKEH
jgi:hypothetical protein